VELRAQGRAVENAGPTRVAGEHALDLAAQLRVGTVLVEERLELVARHGARREEEVGEEAVAFRLVHDREVPESEAESAGGMDGRFGNPAGVGSAGRPDRSSFGEALTEPRAGGAPLVLDRGAGDAEDAGDLGKIEPAEEAQLDDPPLTGAALGEEAQCVLERDEIHAAVPVHVIRPRRLAEGHAQAIAAALGRPVPTGVVDEDPADLDRGEAEELGPTRDIEVARVEQAQVDLVGEGASRRNSL
jgi:hypothetical protein